MPGKVRDAERRCPRERKRGHVQNPEGTDRKPMRARSHTAPDKGCAPRPSEGQIPSCLDSCSVRCLLASR